MGIYIKGMERPTSEEKCKFFQPAPFRAPFCVINGVCNGIDACPLIEVATPHGRLIDADRLVRELKNIMSEDDLHFAELMYIVGQPTILESEDGT